MGISGEVHDPSVRFADTSSPAAPLGSGHRIRLLSPARGRGWVRGMRTSLPPHLASPPSGGEELELCPYRSSCAGEEVLHPAMLSSFAAVPPSTATFCSSLSESQAKMWSTGL